MSAFADWLRQRASRTPERLALAAGDDRWSFRELDERVDRLARALAAAGVQPGDRVGVLMRNGSAFPLVVHALPRLGAVLVPLNVRLAADEIAWQVADAGVRLLVHDAALEGTAVRTGARTASVEHLLTIPPPANPSVGLRDAFETDAVHSIIYTSGTTGYPKGVMLTFGNHWASAIASVLNLGLHTADRWLAVLPLFHVGGLSILLRGAIYGIPVVVHERFDPAAANDAVDREGVTILSVVSTMLARMVEERAERPFPPTLRCLLLGGGPAPRSLLEACAALGGPVTQSYGLTEAASQVATLAPEDVLRKLGSAGKPLMNLDLRIQHDGRTLPPGEVGEIVVHGPTVTPGYAGRPDATAAAIVDGWLRTGDLGYLDDEGYLYVVDRREDLIITGGENVYPAEVEAVLLGHPAVLDAGVWGEPDPEWGKRVAAAVVLRPAASAGEADLLAHCRARLAAYKVPRSIRFVDKLPRTAAGKLRRSRIATLWS